MNPDLNTMTLDECRDWIARDEGWTSFSATNGIVVWHRGSFDTVGEPYSTCKEPHPVPATIDAAASAMPERWWWFRHVWNGEWVWTAVLKCGTIARVIHIRDTDDEKLDRFRLAVACRLAMKEAKT